MPPGNRIRAEYGLQRSFDDMGAPLFEVPFCVLDLETTGGSAATCEITEIGAVKFVGGEEVGRFQTLVNPGVPIPPYITVLTGLTQAMVVEAPKIGEALPSFLEFLGDAVVVGHNVRFDLSFLNAAAERLGYGRLPHRSADTVALARRLLRSEVRNLKLSTLAAYFRSPVAPIHRALDDARATAHVFWALLERAGTLGVSHLEDLLQLPTAHGSPHYGKIALTDALPRRPGVYLFRNRGGEVIYVGKAKNLRTRTRSYFYGDHRRTVAQMLRDLDEIDYRICETELEAEVTELRLITAHVPRYNRRSRPAKSPHWVKLTNERFPRLSTVRSYRDDGCLHLGPFRSRRAAEVVVTAIWDGSLIRRCTGKGGTRTRGCQFAELGVSVCPCDGAVDEAEYRNLVAELRTALDGDPAALFEAIHRRMQTLAAGERFEEAAWCRDRFRALSRALERRRNWQALQRAGTVWAEDRFGDGILVERGRLVAAWSEGGSPPLPPVQVDDDPPPQVPESVADAEEAHLVWRWLTRSGVRIVDLTGELVVPAIPIPRLAA